MGAFWSGTDNANENMTQFYGVYGTIFQQNPAFLFRYVHGDDKKDIQMWELFEKPVTRVQTQVELGDGQVIDVSASSDYEYKGPWPAVNYPDDWMGQHSKSVTVTTSYANNYGGYGATGRGGAYAGNYASGSGYGSGGANTQHRSAYQGAGGYDPEDDPEYFYTGPGRGYSRHQAGAQVVDLDGKKKRGGRAEKPQSDKTRNRSKGKGGHSNKRR